MNRKWMFLPAAAAFIGLFRIAGLVTAAEPGALLADGPELGKVLKLSRPVARLETSDGVGIRAAAEGKSAVYQTKLDWDAAAIKQFIVTAKVEKAGRLRLAADLTDDGRKRSVKLFLNAGPDRDFQEYSFPVGDQADWKGRVTNYELRWFGEEGDVVIKSIRSSSRPRRRFAGRELPGKVRLFKAEAVSSDDALPARVGAQPGGFYQGNLAWPTEEITLIRFSLMSKAAGRIRFACSCKLEGKQLNVTLPPQSVPGDGQYHDYVFVLAGQANWKGVMTNYELRWLGPPAEIGLKEVSAENKAGAVNTLDLATAENRIYRAGEPVTFTATAWAEPDVKLDRGRFVVTVSDGGGKKICDDIVVDLAKNNPASFTVSLDHPGFILAEASECELPDGGKMQWNKDTCSPLAGAAVEPEKIRAGAERPADFDRFWQNALDAYRKAEVIVKPAPEIKRAGYKVSRLTVKFPDGSGLIDGFLSIPEAPGRYPAVAGVPGAGPGAVQPVPSIRSGEPAIELWMNVHNFPTGATAAEQKRRYQEYNNALPGRRYFLHGAEEREQYHFRKVFPALSRAVDHVASLPEFDGRHFAMVGASQGGGTALAVGSLNKNITCIAAMIPALCDQSAWKVGRKSCWPYFHDLLQGRADAAAPYFDTVNFAAGIKVPVLLSVGYIDTGCPPAAVYAAYNSLKGPKRIIPMIRKGHVLAPECVAQAGEFLRAEFRK